MSQETETQIKPISDLGAKSVFRNLRLVATLFKNLTDEFRGMEEEDVEEYIEKDSEGHPLELKDELYDLGTDYVRLDTLLEARVPGKEDDCVRIRFNIETQSYTSSRYAMTDRAQMYAAMLLSTQNKESKGRDKYKNLKRSYTVWICPRAPSILDGKITAYGIRPYPGTSAEIELNSLMDLVFVFPGKPVDDPEERSVTDMLSIIFSKDDAEKRRDRLTSKYKIALDLSTLMEVEHFTDWASEAREDGYDDGYAEGKAAGKAAGMAEGLAQGKAEGLAQGKAEGLAQGKAEGLAQGKAEGMAESIIGVMRRFHCSLEEALEAANVPVNLRDEVLKCIRELQH